MVEPAVHLPCSRKTPLGTIRSDTEANYPRFGPVRPGQQTITCSGCGKLVHNACVEEAGTTISGHHLWFSNMMMRAFVREHGLPHLEVAFCKGCHGGLGDQILVNYKAMERFSEGARFLEDYGWAEEDPRSSRGWKRPSRCWRRSRGDPEVLVIMRASLAPSAAHLEDRVRVSCS